MIKSIFYSALPLILAAFLFGCSGNPSSEKDSEATPADSSLADANPVTMEIEKYADREKDCKGEDCTYVNLQMPVLVGSDEAALNQINSFINGQFHEALKSRLAEPQGNTPLDAMCASFIQSYELFLVEFPDSDQKWYLEIDGTESIVADDYFTLVVNQDEYLGGAHPAVFTQLRSFDLSTGNFIDIVDKYGKEKLLALAERRFRTINELDSRANLNDAGFMFEDGKFTLPENMGLTKEGVLVVYNSYEVASYAQGETRFTIPYSALAGDV